ncbi:MAG TPA: hypothetical protein VL307_06935 [Chitinophagaceae bacterium]|nr:hypothetical protein [Chitinophagaceae bacterium]
MCNCGNKRNQLVLPAQTSMRGTASSPAHKNGPPITFVYTGTSALTVTGTVTGKQYRFMGPGAQQLVDYADASSVTLVPVLKRM